MPPRMVSGFFASKFPTLVSQYFSDETKYFADFSYFKTSVKRISNTHVQGSSSQGSLIYFQTGVLTRCSIFVSKIFCDFGMWSFYHGLLSSRDETFNLTIPDKLPLLVDSVPIFSTRFDSAISFLIPPSCISFIETIAKLSKA